MIIYKLYNYVDLSGDLSFSVKCVLVLSKEPMERLTSACSSEHVNRSASVIIQIFRQTQELIEKSLCVLWGRAGMEG